MATASAFLLLASTTSAAAAVDCVVSDWVNPNGAYSTLENGFCSSSSYYTSSTEDATSVAECETKCSADGAPCAFSGQLPRTVSLPIGAANEWKRVKFRLHRGVVAISRPCMSTLTILMLQCSARCAHHCNIEMAGVDM